MRGKDHDTRLVLGRTRITPAYAGKSLFTLPFCFSASDHPRLCGEKCLLILLHNYLIGSPPPMRGKAQGVRQGSRSAGITPAYAGKRTDCQSLSAGQRDHPRLCGEKREIQAAGKSSGGSPPPMRGKVIFSPFEVYSDRITPAYAGKSGRDTCSAAPHKDHPRLCGEKRLRLRLKAVIQGSPPPMRGKAIAV